MFLIDDYISHWEIRGLRNSVATHPLDAGAIAEVWATTGAICRKTTAATRGQMLDA